MKEIRASGIAHDSIQLAFLLAEKYMVEPIEKRMNADPKCRVKIFVYPPAYPRKYHTVQLIGPWADVVEYKK